MGDRFIVNGSLAHTVGNVTYKFTNYLKNFFGPKFFNYVHVDTRMAWTEFNPLQSTKPAEFIKKNKPILAIKPTVDLLNKDIFLSYSLLTSSTYNQSFRSDAGFNFLPLFRDIQKGICINYKMNRIRVVMDVTMLFDTVVEQINVMGALMNRIEEERPYYMPTALEYYIPKSIMEVLSLESGIPIYDEGKKSVSKFLEYVNMNCSKPITFKEKCATGSEEFFAYYPLRIEYVFSDINLSDVDKIGLVSKSTQISFTLTAEFNTIGSYEYLAADGSNVVKKYDYNMEIDYTKQNLIVPFFTYDKMFDDTNSAGWRYFTSRMYKVDHEDADDIFDLSELFENTMIKELVAYHNKHSIPCTNFIDIKVMIDDKMMEEGPHYTFDYSTLVLTTKITRKESTYRLIIYTNTEYINQLVMENNVEQIKYE